MPIVDNLSCLPFYSTKEQQYKNSNLSGYNTFNLISNPYQTIPFFFELKEEQLLNYITVTANVYNTNDVLITTVPFFLTVDRKHIYSTPIGSLFTLQLDEGYYYIVYGEDGLDTNIMYSEVFMVTNDFDKALKLEFYDNKDFLNIPYSNSYKHILYLDCDLGHSNYEYKEELKEVDLIKFYSNRVSSKLYKFECLTPEWMLDVIRLARLSDVVTITKDGLNIDVNEIVFTPKWIDQTSISNTTFEITTNTILKKLGN